MTRINNRRYEICEAIVNFYEEDDYILTCDRCGQYDPRCCIHDGQTCHHARLVFADGACLSNGKLGARCGVGLASGIEEYQKLSVPLDDVDNGPRTSQRAELLAAIRGLEWLVEGYESRESRPSDHDDEAPKQFVIAMDSAYVVNGITDWIFKWKKNGWRTSAGSKPANLDLFKILDKRIDKYERELGVEIGFWWIPRERNKIADKLAKEAARKAQIPVEDYFAHMLTGLVIE